MATSHPRQRIFETTTTSSFLFILLSTFVFLLIYILGGLILLSPTCEGIHFPGGKEVVPPGLIPLDSEDYNPFESGRSNDAFETLRQLSDASTQSFIRRRLFNTSVALTVPVFSFTLPERFPEGMTIDLANQAMFGVFALLITFMTFAVPVLFTGTRPYNIFGHKDKYEIEHDTDDILDHLMRSGGDSSRTMNFMGADLQNKIGINPEQCLQRTICDAHRYPKKYGIYALPFQLLFSPPPPEGKDSRKTHTIFEMAAQTGEYNKTEKCYEKYRCFFDIMELVIYLRDYLYGKSEMFDDGTYYQEVNY